MDGFSSCIELLFFTLVELFPSVLHEQAAFTPHSCPKFAGTFSDCEFPLKLTVSVLLEDGEVDVTLAVVIGPLEETSLQLLSTAIKH